MSRFKDLTVSRTHGCQQERILQLSPRAVVLIVALIFCGLTLTAFSAVYYYRMMVRTAHLASLESKVDTLRRSNEAFRIAARQLGDQIASLQMTTEKLRVLSGLDVDSMGGVGGPSATDPVLDLDEGSLLKHFRRLDRKRISLQAELQQLQDYYTTRRILMASMPSVEPVRGYLSDHFGYRADPFNGKRDFHPGIDISAPRGTKVLATADGIVGFSGRQASYGKLVTVDHKFGLSTRYGHLNRILVEVGQPVKKGDIIGYVGSTGRATGAHLHYEVRLNSRPLNPLRFFQSQAD